MLLVPRAAVRVMSLPADRSTLPTVGSVGSVGVPSGFRPAAICTPLPVIDPSLGTTPSEPPLERDVTTGVALVPVWVVFEEVKPSVRLAEPRPDFCIAEPKVDGLVRP